LWSLSILKIAKEAKNRREEADSTRYPLQRWSHGLIFPLPGYSSIKVAKTVSEKEGIHEDMPLTQEYVHTHDTENIGRIHILVMSFRLSHF
jgi:hypothetical protein